MSWPRPRLPTRPVKTGTRKMWPPVFEPGPAKATVGSVALIRTAPMAASRFVMQSVFLVEPANDTASVLIRRCATSAVVWSICPRSKSVSVYLRARSSLSMPIAVHEEDHLRREVASDHFARSRAPSPKQISSSSAHAPVVCTAASLSAMVGESPSSGRAETSAARCRSRRLASVAVRRRLFLAMS